MSSPKSILDAAGVQRTITRIGHEIHEKMNQGPDVVLVGIRTRGVTLAERIKKTISELYQKDLQLGTLDITLYRDDLAEIGPKPTVGETKLPFDVSGKIVVLVDDVLYTGRTIRAALDALTDYGRPKAIQLAVLVDRGHRELPIRADIVGKNIPTSDHEEVMVRLSETDDKDEVIVREIPTK